MRVFLILILLISSMLLAFDPPPGPGADIPEPASLLLLGVGGAALMAYKKHKK